MDDQVTPPFWQRVWGDRLDEVMGEMRLLTILPRLPGQLESAPVSCRMERVKLHASALSPDSTMEKPKAPSVDLDKYVRRPPIELWPVPAMEESGIKPNVFKRFFKHVRAHNRFPIYAGVELDIEDHIILTENQEPMSEFIVRHPIDSNDNPIFHNQQMKLWSPAYRKPPMEDIPSRWKWGNYVALSYVWGPDDPTNIMILNGETHYIRDNLDSALRQLREFGVFKDGLKIWIDALCINQNDKGEIKEQVPRMDLIYSQAGNVIAWLGERSEDSDYAIDIIESTSKLYRTEYLQAMDGCDLFTAHAHRQMALLKLRASRLKFAKRMRQKKDFSDEEQELITVYDFFNRPYWRRLWIIQELAMGFSGMAVVCGRRVTQWRYIRDFTLLFHSVPSIVETATMQALLRAGRTMDNDLNILHIASIAQIERVNHKTYLPPLDDFTQQQLPGFSSGAAGGFDGALSGITLRQILKLMVDSEASEDRDKVYGMKALPVVRDMHITVDYDKSTATLYKEFVHTCIKSSDSGLDILSFLDGRLSIVDDEELPSWVPNFAMSADRRLELFEGRFYAGQPFFLGSNSSMMTSASVRDENTLTFEGFVADEIDGLGAVGISDLEFMLPYEPYFDPGVVQPSNLDDLTGQIEISHVDVYYTLVGGAGIDGGPVPEDFYKLLNLGDPLAISRKNHHFLRASASLRLTSSGDLGSYFTPPIGSVHEKLGTRAYSDPSAASSLMQARTKNRRLIVTRGGYLGLAPASARKSDRIVIIEGWARPVLLRRIPTVNVDDDTATDTNRTIAMEASQPNVYANASAGAGPGGYDRSGRWDGKTYYKMIGEVYVAEMMKGEMVRGGVCGGRNKFRDWDGIGSQTYWLKDEERIGEWRGIVRFYVK